MAQRLRRGEPPRRRRWPFALFIGVAGVLLGVALWAHTPDMPADLLTQRYAELQRFPGNRQATLERLRTQEALDPTTLKRLDVPTLIIWGAQDKWVPPADGFRFQGDIKGSKLSIFEKAGHNPMEEEPAATAAAVNAFLPAKLAPRPEPALPLQPSDAATSGQVRPSVEPEKD